MKALKKNPTWAKSAGDANLSKMAVLALHPSPILATLIYSYYALCSSLFFFFLLTGNLNINPPPPPPPLHVICCFWSLNPYLRISPHFFEDATLFVVRRIRERTRVQKKPTADANEIPGKIRGGFWSKLAYPWHMKWAFPPKSWHISAAQDKFTI